MVKRTALIFVFLLLVCTLGVQAQKRPDIVFEDFERKDYGRWTVTGTAFGAHDLGWLRKQQDRLPDGDGVELVDGTGGLACFGVWGPNARALLAPLTTTPLTNAAFPYLTAQSITVGSIPVVALRVTAARSRRARSPQTPEARARV